MRGATRVLVFAAAAMPAVACDRSSSAPSSASASSSASIASTAASTSVAAGAASSNAPSPPSASTSSGKTWSTIGFDEEPIGSPPSAFEIAVGDWAVAVENGNKVLKVGGGSSPTTPTTYPLAVFRGDVSGDARVSVRFFAQAGKIDQAAGIAFGIAGDGYWGVRVNALENDLLFFHVVKGKRTVLDEVANVPTTSKAWHVLAVELAGAHVTATLDEKTRWEKTLDFQPIGRIGLWSKADSRVLFDDVSVTTP